MNLRDTMTAGQIKAYADEHVDVCTAETYKTRYILTEYVGSPRGDSVTVTVFERDDVRDHRNPDNERYVQLFDVTGDNADTMISAAKRKIDAHERLKSLSNKMEMLDNQWEFDFLMEANNGAIRHAYRIQPRPAGNGVNEHG